MNVAYCIDCMEALRSMPDKSFDLAVVDPPYFSGPERRRFYGNEFSAVGVHRTEYHVAEKWEVPGPEYFRELERVSKRYIVFGCNYFEYIFSPGRIVWDKCNGDSSYSDCEIAATNCHDSVRIFHYLWNGMMQGKGVLHGKTQRGDKTKNERRIHPTQKPIDLYRWIFTNYAKPDFKILDTHLGSGSSRIAAYEAGLSFLGYEIDRCYFELQEERFLSHIAQISLFHKAERCGFGAFAAQMGG